MSRNLWISFRTIFDGTSSFIGALQSNKAKFWHRYPTSIVHTVTLIKASMALNKSLPPERTSLLNVLLQVNTSGEDTKSDLTPLSSPESSSSEPVQLVRQSSQSVLGFTGTYDYRISGRVAHLVKMWT
ncbi:hypothetical protein SCLCIDRAFT_1019883 [Scleroderma citrinum Foug A]|uniref:Uncharacterized protein n=1 Tax=Scleroderma citrinum Foug A TaxID=1036808 RepID=A0A0C3DT52_9AGAM|nr:hypothetical protein SCLCIDRAFT_1019883 [Scleroderma citrinum Foug A]